MKSLVTWGKDRIEWNGIEYEGIYGIIPNQPNPQSIQK